MQKKKNNKSQKKIPLIVKSAHLSTLHTYIQVYLKQLLWKTIKKSDARQHLNDDPFCE